MLLFTKLLECTIDPTNPDQCFSIIKGISEGLWIVLIWPFATVILGLIVGYVVAVMTKTSQKNVAVASIAFSSISIPLVLALAIIDGLPPSTSVRTNPIT